MMPFTEDITITQCTNILKLITFEYQVHLEHCRLCLPGEWLCPDAHLLMGNIKHWVERLTRMLPKEGGTS